MPCDQVRTTTVNLEVADLDALEAALKGLRYEVNREGPVLTFSKPGSYYYSRYANGQLQVEGNQSVTKMSNEIRRAYSHEIVQRTATKFGWQVKADPRKKYEYNVQRRR